MKEKEYNVGDKFPSGFEVIEKHYVPKYVIRKKVKIIDHVERKGKDLYGKTGYLIFDQRYGYDGREYDVLIDDETYHIRERYFKYID